jgi:hypothetical protein
MKEKNAAGIERLIARRSRQTVLIGRIQDMIDLAIMDANQENDIDAPKSLLDLLCTDCGHV